MPEKTTMSMAQEPFRGDLFDLFMIAASQGFTRDYKDNNMHADCLIETLVARGIPANTTNLKAIHQDWGSWTFFYDKKYA